MKERLQARNAVRDFFNPKRDALKVKSVFNFSPENRAKRRFLAEMNAMSRDLENKAMTLADKGKDTSGIIQEAQDGLDKLKKDFIISIGGDDFTLRVIHETAIKEIESL